MQALGKPSDARRAEGAVSVEQKQRCIAASVHAVTLPSSATDVDPRLAVSAAQSASASGCRWALCPLPSES